MNLDIIVMAGGKGTRMNSALPKVLHELNGKPMLQHVLEAADAVDPDQIVVVYHHAMVKRFVKKLLIDHRRLVIVHQEQALGTGDAVQQALPHISKDGVTVVLNGDVPLIQPLTISNLFYMCSGVRLALLTVELDDPTGYGRIVCGEDGRIQAIVEHNDATDEQRAIKEIYTGIMAVPSHLLRTWIPNLTNDNAQGEYYLTDIVKMMVKQGISIVSTHPTNSIEVLGVNSPAQLAKLEVLMESKSKS